MIKSYRITISSDDKLNGANNADNIYQIKLIPTVAFDSTKKYHFKIEQFVSSVLTFISPTLICFPSLSQSDSYNTIIKGPNDIVAIIANDFYCPVTHDSIGYPLSSLNFLSGSQLQIQFKDYQGDVLGTSQIGNWVMQIVIYEIPEDKKLRI